MSKQHLLFSIPRTCWTWLQHWIGPVLQLPPSRGTAVAKEIAGRARAKAVKKCIVWKAVGSSLFFLPRLTLDFILKSTCRFWDGTILWVSENGNERSCHFDIPVSRLFRNTSDAALWQHIVFICAGWSQDLNCLLHLHRVLGSNSTGREILYTRRRFRRRLFSSVKLYTLESVVMVLRFIFFSCVLTISPYVQNNCLDPHLARGHFTTSGDNAVTVF